MPEAAELAGVSLGTVQQLENGTTDPANVRARTIVGLARAYRVQESDILDMLMGRA